MRNRRRGFPAALVVCVLICRFALGQKSFQELPPEEVLQTFAFGDFRPDLSPSGGWLAYTLQDPRRTLQGKENSQRFFSVTGAPVAAAGTDVWITNTDSGESRNLTLGKGANWGASWSPDGKALAFYSDRDGQARVWIYDMEKKTIRRIAEGIVRVPDPWQVPCWSPDGTQILTKLLSDEDELGELDKNVVSLDKAAIGKGNPSKPTILVYRSSEETGLVHQKEETPVLVEDERTRAERADVGVITVATGAVRRMARRFNPVWYSWSPDGSQLAFATMKGLYRGEVYRELFDLLLVSPSGEMKVIDSDIPRNVWDFAASWSPTGNELSYVVAGGDENGECYVVPLNGKPRRKATNDTHPAFSPFHQTPMWSSSGQDLYLVSSTYGLWTISLRDDRARELSRIPNHRIYAIVGPSGGARPSSPDGERSILVSTLDDSTRESGFYGIDVVTGAFRKLRSENKSYDLGRIASTGDASKIVYAAEDIAHAPDFFISNTDFTNIRQLTNINPSLARFRMGDGRLLRWRTGDGDVVQGALLLPSNYQEGKRYPLVVEVYPGLFSPCVNQFGLCGENFFPNKQLFATRGYAVLMPDLRLTGRTMMADLANIVLSGVNQTIDLGIVDSDRVGLMGTSWGGYSTLALITQTSRFKAAVMVAGFGDLLGLYGEMDEGGSSLGVSILEEGRFPMPGTPWEFRSLYVENSPIFYLDRVKTPLLILHGSKDTNVAPFLSDEIFVGLRRLRKRATYVKYEGEVHGINSYENQIDSFNRMIEWFDGYLGRHEGGETVPPKTLSRAVGSAVTPKRSCCSEAGFSDPRQGRWRAARKPKPPSSPVRVYCRVVWPARCTTLRVRTPARFPHGSGAPQHFAVGASALGRAEPHRLASSLLALHMSCWSPPF